MRSAQTLVILIESTYQALLVIHHQVTLLHLSHHLHVAHRILVKCPVRSFTHLLDGQCQRIHQFLVIFQIEHIIVSADIDVLRDGDVQRTLLLWFERTHRTFLHRHPVSQALDGVIPAGTTQIVDFDRKGIVPLCIGIDINQLTRISPTHGVAVDKCRPRHRLCHLVSVQVFNTHGRDVHRRAVNILSWLLQGNDEFIILCDKVETEVTLNTLCPHRSISNTLQTFFHLHHVGRTAKGLIRRAYIPLLFGVPFVVVILRREFHLRATTCNLSYILIEWDVCQQSWLHAVMTFIHALLHHITRQCHVPKGDFVDEAIHGVERFEFRFTSHLTQLERCVTIKLTEARSLRLSRQFAIHVSRSHIGRTIHHEGQLVPLIIGIALVHDNGGRVATNGQLSILHADEELLVGFLLTLHAIARSHDGEVILLIRLEPHPQRVALIRRSPFKHLTIQFMFERYSIQVEGNSIKCYPFRIPHHQIVALRLVLQLFAIAFSHRIVSREIHFVAV